MFVCIHTDVCKSRYVKLTGQCCMSSFITSHITWWDKVFHQLWSVQSGYSGSPASSKDLPVFISQPSARLKMSALIPSCYMAAEGQTLTTVILCGRHFTDCAISPVLKNFNFRS